jgi:hypothetical protein
MGSYSWNGGTGGWNTLANWTGGIPNSTLADVAIVAAGNYIVTLEASGNDTVDSLTISDGGATLDLLGHLTLGGALDLFTLSAGELILGGTIYGGNMDFEGGSTLAYAGGHLSSLTSFTLGASATIDLNGGVLAIGGSVGLNGYINGPGSLEITRQATVANNLWIYDGATLLDAGTIVQTGQIRTGVNGTAAEITIAAGALYDINAQNSQITEEGTSFIYNAGLFEENFATGTNTSSYDNIYNFTNASTGTLSAVSANSNISLYGNDALGGYLTGAGDIYDFGTTTLEAGLHDNVAALEVNSGYTLVLAATATLGHEFDIGTNAVLDLNGNVLTLAGTGSVRSYVDGGGTILLAGSYDIGGLYLASGTEELVTGTVVDDVYNTRLDYDNGTAASILSIASTGTYNLAQTNAQIDYNGPVGTIINSGLFENINTQSSYFNTYDAFTNASTGTIYVGAGDDISLIRGPIDLFGTIEGAGGLFIGQGSTAKLEASLVLSSAAVTFGDGGTDIILESNRTFAQSFDEINGAAVSLNGDTLALAGGGVLGAYLNGPGIVNISGTYTDQEYIGSGVTTNLTGTLYQVNSVSQDYDNGSAASVLSISSAGTYAIISDSELYNGNNNGAGTGKIVNAGLFEKIGVTSYSNIYSNFTNASTGTIYIAGGGDDLSFLGPNNDFSGTIEGPGYIYFGYASHSTLEAALTLNIGIFTISDGGTNVKLGGNRSFGNQFTMQNSSALNLNGHTLNLTGNAYLGSSAGAYGPGTINLTGSGDIGGYYVYGKAVLLDNGFITQDGFLELGNGSADTAHMTIATGATYEILDNSNIGQNGTAAVTNNGLFEKIAANDASLINVKFNNGATGTIAALPLTTLQFGGGGSLAGTLTGGGEINLAGGTFSLAALATVNVATFEVNGAQLDISANRKFTDIFDETGGNVNLEGFTLTAAGSSSFYNASVTGFGALIIGRSSYVYGYTVDGAARLIDTGTVLQGGNVALGNNVADTSSLTIASGAVWDILGDGYGFNADGHVSIVNSGLFEKTGARGFSSVNVNFTNTGSGIIDAVSGDIGIYGGLIGGTLTGAGEIDLDGNGMTLKSTIVNVGVLGINAGVTLANSLTYGGDFILSGTDTLFLGSNTLSLTGSANLVGGFDGPGLVVVKGSATVNQLDLFGGTELVLTGTVDQIGQLRFGLNDPNPGPSDLLSIASGAVYLIQDDTGFQDFGGNNDTVINAGLLEKTALIGTSDIQPSFANSGTVLSTLGVLQFDTITNLTAGTLTGGIWDAAGGEILVLGGTVTTDAANIIISGTGGSFVDGANASSTRSLASSLTAIATGGTLQILKGASFADGGLADAGTEIVGGTVSGGTVVTGGLELVLSGGTASAAHIGGGVLQVNAGGVISGSIGFSGTGGELIIGSPTLPTNVISGFAAGDTIQLAGIAYVSGASVTVTTAGTVSVIDGGHTYSLNIAGATVGESDLFFSSGSLLTKGSAPQAPKFLAPVGSATKPAVHWVMGAQGVEMFRAQPAAAVAPAALAVTSSGGGAGYEALAVHRGGAALLLAERPQAAAVYPGSGGF